jgi:hypothetical protein
MAGLGTLRTAQDVPITEIGSLHLSTGTLLHSTSFYMYVCCEFVRRFWVKGWVTSRYRSRDAKGERGRHDDKGVDKERVLLHGQEKYAGESTTSLSVL